MQEDSGRQTMHLTAFYLAERCNSVTSCIAHTAGSVLLACRHHLWLAQDRLKLLLGSADCSLPLVYKHSLSICQCSPTPAIQFASPWLAPPTVSLASLIDVNVAAQGWYRAPNPCIMACRHKQAQPEHMQTASSAKEEPLHA